MSVKQPAVEQNSLFLPINATSGHLCHFGIAWYIKCNIPHVGLSTRKQNTGEVILQMYGLKST